MAVAYCTKDDLLAGNVPLPAYIDADKKVGDAADEINSRLGFLYSVPIDVSEGSLLSETARLLLKRCNAHLASGRIIMALDAGGQNNSLHRYGMYLIRQAELIMEGILNGSTPLEGAPPAAGYAPATRGPLISNVDPTSKVEDFYDRFRYRGPRWP